MTHREQSAPLLLQLCKQLTSCICGGCVWKEDACVQYVVNYVWQGTWTSQSDIKVGGGGTVGTAPLLLSC
jgi:hypothetical protein